MTDTLYDKAGTAFAPDHEANGKVYVRPMIRVVMQSTNYSGDDFHESEDFEPAPYLIAMDRADLFDAPPVSQVNADIAAARATLKSIQADAAKEARCLRAERDSAENELRTAQRQLAEWMTKHQPMIELGKLLDGKVLFPLSVAENRYHGGREIPSIPKMSEIGRLEVLSGNFEKGQAWKFKRHLSDHYGSPFRFYDTDAERSAVIAGEFDATCDQFRKHPNFDTTSHTSGTTLHYGTLTKWVECHPALSIPEDIEAMKLENDARLYDARRAKLAAELAALDHPA